MKRVWVVLVLVAACGSHGNGHGGDDDGMNPDGGGSAVGMCGDGVVDGNEQCDDGNTTSGDGCSASCENEGTGLCSPYSFRCGAGGDVETCNNAGTAWLEVQACATGCSNGVCTDPTCTPGATRCHGNSVETCNTAGTGWDPTETCSTYCAAGQCALGSLDVGQNSNYHGTVIVAGDFSVGNNSTLTADTGDLTIVADNITVAAGAAIAVAPTGTNKRGESCYDYYYYSVLNANYGAPYGSTMQSPYGGDDDANVEPGSVGGRGGTYACNNDSVDATTHGGGTLRLIARHNVTIAGQLIAPGQDRVGYDPSGGSGGGIQIAGDTITITGSISTAGGGSAGYGRVRLLYGNVLNNTGTIIGNLTQGRRPPIDLTSPTHPDPTLVYNDGFAKVTIAHERPFLAAQGYLHAVDPYEYNPPQPDTGTFAGTESFDVDAKAFRAGDNWIHIASVDASSALSPVEARFHVNVNTDAPDASSTSHTSPTTWYDNPNPYFAWTNPQGLDDRNWRRVHYVLDHFGDTVPAITDSALPMSQKQLLVSNLAPGIWVLHVVTEDTMGYLTKNAAHVVVRVGPDPGSGTVFGSVFDEHNQPVSGATVRVNRGLFQGTTNSSGSFSITGVAAGTWEISVVYPDHTATAQMLTVTANGQASANFTLQHI